MRRLGLPAALLALVAMLTAGCGVKDEPTDGAARFPARAVDAAGVPVELAAAPDRIVSADPGASAILRDVGLGDALVEVEPAAAARAAADPATDLVVLPLALAAGPAAAIAETAAGPVYRYGAAPLADAPRAITQLGLVVGRGPEAAAVARSVAGGLDALARRLDDETPVRTLIEGPGATALGPGTPIGQAVAAAGGESVFGADALWTPQELPALDVQAWVSADPGGSSAAALQGIAELAAVPAVRDGRVIAVPARGYPIDAALPRALTALADQLRAAPVAP